MNPRLIGIVGPPKGATFGLADKEFSIGRGPGNKLITDDPKTSRGHCLIKKEAARYKIRDLDSRNGTFVNGVPVRERWLEHGDQIQVGESMLVFLLHDAEAAAATSPVQLEEQEWVPWSTAELRPEETVYLQSQPPAAVLPATERTVRDFNALVRISTSINSMGTVEAIQRKLLESVLEVVPAEHGAVILCGEDADEFGSIATGHRVPGAEEPVQVSRTAARRVLRECVSLLSNDVLQNATFSKAESLKTSQTRSLLVVPIVLLGKPLGVIYLYTIDPRVQFDENHLQLVTAIAGTAAPALENARRMELLEHETQRLQAEIDIEHDMVGESPKMRQVHRFIAKVAATDSTALICGESGTGKELVARAIHRNSLREGEPFVAINCAALMETLLESELFGHERGAFTGALVQKKGKLEVAEGGTVFLDEIGELATPLQTKLLRVLQEREFERVGGTRPIKVNVRLIAATNRDLNEAVERKSFRQDLFYRLNVVSLTMPPLRERREDIPLLASHFAAKHGMKSKRRVDGLSPEARRCLLNYDWPGNVRELENAIERAIVLGTGEQILPEDLPETLLEAASPASVPITRYHEGVAEAKKQLILRAIGQAGGNYTEAAKLLGVRATYLHRLMRNMNLKSTHAS
jgi:Nif-specific regulatory protein